MREINYDKVLCEAKLKITIGGEKYEIPEPSLQQILDYETKVNELKEGLEKEVTAGTGGDLWIAIIKTMFTEIPEKVLRNQKYPVLKQIAADCTEHMSKAMYGEVIADKKQQEQTGKKKAK